MKQEEFNKIYKQIIKKDTKLNEILNSAQLYSELIKHATRKIIKGYIFSKPYYQMTATLRTYLLQSFALSIENAKDYLFTHSEKVLVKKAQEYAAPEDDEPDRLHNFKCAKKYFDIDDGFFCINLMLKHIISITDILEGKVDADMAMIKEKWLDTYNYCILLEAIEEDI